MKKLILGFSRPKKFSLFAQAIMWADKTQYDHVYVKWNWPTIERDVIYQASKLFVNFESNTTFDQHAISVHEFEIEISDDCHKNIMQFCMDNSNKPYGIKQILGFIVVKLLGFMGKKISNPVHDKGATFICSELGADIIKQAGIEIDENVEDIDPLDLYNIAIKANLKKIK